jgi:hypothetical protein
MVQFDVYSDGSGIRLVNVGVLEHVPYQSNNQNDVNNNLFKVA